MKIVVIGSQLFDSLEHHFCDSFEQLGHTCTLIDYMRLLPIGKLTYWSVRFARPYRDALNKLTIRKIAAEKPDLIVGVYRSLPPSLIDGLRQRLGSIPIAQVNPDHPAVLEQQQIMASDYDFYFSKEPYMVDFLRHKAGVNAHYLPEGFNPRFHRKPLISKQVSEEKTQIDVLMYGSLYPYRVRVIEQLVRAGIRPVIYGSVGRFCPPDVRALSNGRHLAGDEKNRMVHGAKIVFNLFHYGEFTSANQKFFEIYGAGGFQLCDYKPTLNEYSATPPAAFTFASTDEAIDRIRHFLSRPDERHAIAEEQYQHFQQGHTFDQRACQLLTIMGLN